MIEKHDVVLPSLDSLELILEPDGSPTDDFVLSEDFPGHSSKSHRRQER